MLLEQALEYLAPRGEGELMVDATMGEGGHSHAFLSRFPSLSIIGVDADSTIQAVARERLAGFSGRVDFYRGRAQDFFTSYPAGGRRPNTVLADLGISVFHYEKSGRGFSFFGDEPLDMRLDPSVDVSAAELLARMSEKDIADMLYQNADERYSRRIARAIVQARHRGAIVSAVALAELVKQSVPASYRYGPIHPATRTFLALRIVVNGELLELPNLLEGALRVLEPGGRLGIMCYHSLEDRVVKNLFKKKSRDCTCPPEVPSCRCTGRTVRLLTRKGLTPDAEEIKRNPPSRSARFRVVEKIKDAEAV